MPSQGSARVARCTFHAATVWKKRAVPFAILGGMADQKNGDPTVPEETRQGRKRWESAAARSFEKAPAWKSDFTTVSGAAVDPLAGPDTLAGVGPER